MKANWRLAITLHLHHLKESMYNNSVSSKITYLPAITIAATTLTITLILAVETVIIAIIPQKKKY